LNGCVLQQAGSYKAALAAKDPDCRQSHCRSALAREQRWVRLLFC
jgi:hypothetical protein